MRHYVDLHLKPSTPEQAFEMMHCSLLNSGTDTSHQLSNVTDSVESITVATRIDIEAKRGRELQDALR